MATTHHIVHGYKAEGNGRKAHGTGQKAGAWRMAWKVDDEGLNIQPEIEEFRLAYPPFRLRYRIPASPALLLYAMHFILCLTPDTPFSRNPQLNE